MAYELHNGHAFPGIAASNVQRMQVVRTASGANAPQRGVAPVGGPTEQPLGFALTDALAGRGVTVHVRDNHVKARAGASVGVGGLVGAVAGTIALAPGVASGSFAVGEAMTEARAGEIFTVLVNPQRV